MDDPRQIWLRLADEWDRQKHSGNAHLTDVALRRLEAFEELLAEMLDMQIRSRLKRRPKSGDSLEIVLGEDIKASIWEQMDYWRKEAQTLTRQVDRMRTEMQSICRRLEALEGNRQRSPLRVAGGAS